MRREPTVTISTNPEEKDRATAFDWVKPSPYRCPRCSAIHLSKELAARCPSCGFKESAT